MTGRKNLKAELIVKNATHDKMETSEVQAERIRHQRCRGDILVALQSRRRTVADHSRRAARGDRNAAVLTDGNRMRSLTASRSGSKESVSGPQRRGIFFTLCFSRNQTLSLRKDFVASAQLYF